jgi:hypothetical protein
MFSFEPDPMAGLITYWFCAAASLILVIWGFVDALFVHHLGGIMLFCWVIGSAFYLSGVWVRRKSRAAPSRFSSLGKEAFASHLPARDGTNDRSAQRGEK